MDIFPVFIGFVAYFAIYQSIKLLKDFASVNKKRPTLL